MITLLTNYCRLEFILLHHLLNGSNGLGGGLWKGQSNYNYNSYVGANTAALCVEGRKL